jgi:hypothetical protein
MSALRVSFPFRGYFVDGVVVLCVLQVKVESSDIDHRLYWPECACASERTNVTFDFGDFERVHFRRDKRELTQGPREGNYGRRNE